MNVLILSCLATVALALPQGYSAPRPTYSSQCGPGEVRRLDGSCARPIVTRNLFLYNAPRQELSYGPPPRLPDPKVHYNFVFVRTPNQVGGVRPIVAPAPQQKTLVYLLSQRPGPQAQQVIEVPNNPTQPEVFFVNYNEGENAELPGGIDLQTALSQSAQQGQVISGGSQFDSGFSSSSGGFGSSSGGGFSSSSGGGFGSSSGSFVSGGGFSSGSGFVGDFDDSGEVFIGGGQTVSSGGYGN